MPLIAGNSASKIKQRIASNGSMLKTYKQGTSKKKPF